MPNRIIFFAVVAGWLGGCFAAVYTFLPPLVWVSGGAALVGFFLVRSFRLRALAATLAAFFIAAALAPVIFRFRTPLLPYGENTRVHATVVEAPLTFKKTQSAVITTRAFGRPTRLALRVPESDVLEVGDEVTVEGVLNPLSQFKEESVRVKSLRTNVWGEFSFGTAISDPTLEPLNSPMAALRRVRRFAGKQVQTIREPYAGLLGGLLWGDQKAIDPTLYDEFAKAGVSHIVALSGYNISILIRALRPLIVLVGLSGYALVSALIVGAFVLFSGASATVVRAALFGGVLVFGELIGRPANALPALGLVAVGMTLVNPALVVDLSWQLSFLATGGLLILGPIFHRPLHARKIPQVFAEPLSATLAATAVTLPRIIGTFGRLSFVSPLSNVLILPVVPAAMGLGALAIATSAIPGVGSIFSTIALVPLWWIVFVTDQVLRLPYAFVESSIPEYVWWIILGVLVGVLWMRTRKQTVGK